MTVGFFAPMPPARTGVADYAAALLQALRERGEVKLRPASASVNLYHLGNNQLHAEIYRRALREPGVIVLHDAVLHHFMLGSLAPDEYANEFAYNYGDWSRDLAADLWAHRARSAGDRRYFEYPMLRRVVERSRAVVVHNPAAAAMVLNHVPGARVEEIPHIAFESSPPPAPDVISCRRHFGVGLFQPLCGVFGYLRESKRLTSVIAACERTGTTLLIAGECPAQLARTLEPHLHKPFIRRVPFASPSEFNLLAHSVDVCANLRYPSAGETSGIGVRLMGIGKPVLVTDSPENSGSPVNACIRIQSGLPERAHLAAALNWIATFPSQARAVGTRSQAFIRSHHHPSRIADLYWQLLRSV